MKAVSAAAYPRRSYVQPDARLSGQGSDVSAEPHKWRDLLDPVIQAKEALNLNPTDLSVLRTILSFIPTDVLSLSRPDGHICFAQNTTIADRLGRSGDSTVNRAVRRLEEAGLITRRYSGNRKRYARRSSSGDITHAYGIDVAPLIENRTKIDTLATIAREKTERLSCLREDCKTAIAKLLQRLFSFSEAISQKCHDCIENARKALRRKPEEEALGILKSELEELLTRAPCQTTAQNQGDGAPKGDKHHTGTAKLSTANRQPEQHKEPKIHNQSVLKSKRQITFERLENSFPKLMCFLRTSKDMDDFHRNADTLALSLGDTTNAWKHAKNNLGFQIALLLLGYIVENHDKISNHGGYLRSMSSKILSGELMVSSLLAPKNHLP